MSDINASKTEPKCLRVIDAGAYLLGGLSAEEALAFRMHADQCDVCAGELAELKSVVNQLQAAEISAGSATAVETPSPGLRERIVASALAEVGASDVPGAQIVDLRSRPRSSSQKLRRAGVAAAASVALLGAGGGLGYAAHPAASPPPSSRAVYWGTGQESAPQKVVFASNTAGTKAWAAVSSGPAGTYAALYTKGLQAGWTYKWWFEKVDGSRVPLGSFVFPADQQDWVVCPGGTSVERVELKAVGATDGYGRDVLRAELPPAPQKI